MNEPITVVPRVIGAIIAVVLQIALAPNIALFGVVPNFIMAYVLIVSIVCPDQSGPVFAFVLGLLFDLLGTGPVGAMAFLLTGVSFLAKRIFMLVNNDTPSMHSSSARCRAPFTTSLRRLSSTRSSCVSWRSRFSSSLERRIFARGPACW